ncbi:MAG: tRNA 2-thiouridine(34) synthase MnmA [Gammaproteobacteria bacterium]|nr:tRNA 2-thiouridine(34) synthase MnmA [Gammaproteobacteria bacterium]
MKQTVFVGLSGGVDSAVATLLLQQQGYCVEALFMKNWEEDDSSEYCSAAEDLADAQQVADRLGVKLHTVNFSGEYWDHVFEHFLAEYRAGRTPNPDIICNKEIKFKAFLDYAVKLGADKIATGHYARIREQNGQFQLLRGLDNNKDQSYFLHAIGQPQLSKSLFPIGELQKSKVREIAAQAGFANHAKKDSTGICFIGERKFKDFLETYLPANPGEIQTPNGEVIGQHHGLMYYTLGQRQGLGIGGKKEKSEEPWYVLGKDLDKNVLIAGQGHNHPLLFQSRLHCQNLSWTLGETPQLPIKLSAKTRYRQQDINCTLLTGDSTAQLEVQFAAPVRAITPGQSVVFYADELCLGGGVIE